MQTLLPEMMRGNVRPLKEAVGSAAKPALRQLVSGCALVACACQERRDDTREMLKGAVEGYGATDHFRAALDDVEEALRVCEGAQALIVADTSSTAADRKRVESALAKITEIRGFYAELLSSSEKVLNASPPTFSPTEDFDPSTYVRMDDWLKTLDK